MNVADIPSEAIVAAIERAVTTVREREDPVELKESAHCSRTRTLQPARLRNSLPAQGVGRLRRASGTERGRARGEPRRAAPRRGDRRSHSRCRCRTTPGNAARAAPAAAPGTANRPHPASAACLSASGATGASSRDDLAELISGSVAVERSDLGEIRVLDSYSFVEVPEPVAEDTIAAFPEPASRGGGSRSISPAPGTEHPDPAAPRARAATLAAGGRQQRGVAAGRLGAIGAAAEAGAARGVGNMAASTATSRRPQRRAPASPW